MPPKQKESTNKRVNKELAADWSDEDIALLIDTLYALPPKYGTDAKSASFKKPAFVAASKALEEIPRISGGPKTMQSCKDKWKTASISAPSPLPNIAHVLISIFLKLKAQYAACVWLQNVSGFAWNPLVGCAVENMDEDAWKDWVKIKVRSRC